MSDEAWGIGFCQYMFKGIFSKKSQDENAESPARHSVKIVREGAPATPPPSAPAKAEPSPIVAGEAPQRNASGAPFPPAEPSPAAPSTPSAPAASEAPPELRRIMVVDDDPIINKLMQHRLKPISTDVQYFTDLPEALMAVQSQDFELIISDFQLPSGECLDFLKKYRRLRPHTPILIISGFLSFEKVLEISKLGVSGVYTKPLNVKDFLTKIKELLKESSPRQAAPAASPAASSKSSSEEHQANAEAVYNAQGGYLHGISEPHAELIRQIERYKDFSGTMQFNGPPGSEFDLVAMELVRLSRFSDAPPIFLRPSDLKHTFFLNALKAAELQKREMTTFVLLEGHSLDKTGQANLEQLLKREGVYRDYARRFRLIFCSEEDISEKVDKGEFSEFLYFSIGLVGLNIPSLVERKEDVPFLIKRIFAEIKARQPSIAARVIQPDVVAWFQSRVWSHNYAEMREKLEWIILNCPVSTVDMEQVKLAALPGSKVGGNTGGVAVKSSQPDANQGGVDRIFGGER